MEFSLYEIFWYFVIYAVLGWVVEVCFCSIKTGSFVNRGFLNGPVCPIYGFGMVAVLVCLWPLRNSMLVLYVGRRGAYQRAGIDHRLGAEKTVPHLLVGLF